MWRSWQRASDGETNIIYDRNHVCHLITDFIVPRSLVLNIIHTGPYDFSPTKFTDLHVGIESNSGIRKKKYPCNGKHNENRFRVDFFFSCNFRRQDYRS
jgi:hypothetical protein